MSRLSLCKTSFKGLKSPGVQISLNHVARSSSQSYNPDDDMGEFRQLQIRPQRFDNKYQRRRPSIQKMMPRDFKRSDKIDPVTVDWKSVWPGPRTFDPNAIPIPVRQGRLKQHFRAFDKYANMELMKIPNFFHISPAAVKAQCEVLKKFCTPFPEQLDTKEKCEKHFPLTVTTHDYLHSAPTIRDPLSRIVTIQLKLKDIPLDEHARDKFIRLVRDRYNDKTDVLTITTDRCPLKKQNYDYAMYLLTALYCESWVVEEWESQKSEADMEKYIWENNMSSKAVASLVKWTPDKFDMAIFHDPLPTEELQPQHIEYGKAVKKVVEAENDEALENYKKAVLQILALKPKEGTLKEY